MGRAFKVRGTVKRRDANGREGETETYDLVITEIDTPGPADHAILTIRTSAKGVPMPGSLSITVDDTTATAVLTFEDRVDEATGPPLSSDGSTPAVVAYTSDNPAVATVDPTSGVLSEVAAGTVNIGATVDDAVTGNPVLEPDGVTPFAPAPINVTVTPGVAVSDTFTVNP